MGRGYRPYAVFFRAPKGKKQCAGTDTCYGAPGLSDSPLVTMRDIERGKVRVTRQLFGADQQSLPNRFCFLAGVPHRPAQQGWLKPAWAELKKRFDPGTLANVFVRDEEHRIVQFGQTPQQVHELSIVSGIDRGYRRCSCGFAQATPKPWRPLPLKAGPTTLRFLCGSQRPATPSPFYSAAVHVIRLGLIGLLDCESCPHPSGRR